MPGHRSETLTRLRQLILALLGLGLVGTAVDLLALRHYQDPWQITPLATIAAALAVLVWHYFGGGTASVRALRAVMIASIVIGGLGFLLHYQSNLEFQLEMDATQSHWSLLTKVLRAQAPPAFAPMSMGLLGFLGLLYTFRIEERGHD